MRRVSKIYKLNKSKSYSKKLDGIENQLNSLMEYAGKFHVLERKVDSLIDVGRQINAAGNERSFVYPQSTSAFVVPDRNITPLKDIKNIRLQQYNANNQEGKYLLLEYIMLEINESRQRQSHLGPVHNAVRKTNLTGDKIKS